MKSTCIINSNRGRYKYKLTPTGFTSLRLRLRRGMYVTYCIDRTNILAALSGSVSGVRVYVYYPETDKGQNFTFAVKLIPSGCLWIGCRHFNKSTTRLLRKWFTC